MSSSAITVCTAARLHMGFLDLSENRTFGSVGLSLNAPQTVLMLTLGEEGCDGAELAGLLETLKTALNIDTPVRVQVKEAIPRHAGLGSGTQLALALGTGLSQLFDLNLSCAHIAAITGRGKRSGIGLAAFEQGGFIVDSGKTSVDAAPAVLARVDFPADWRVILVQDDAHIGVHGAAEKSAFQTLKPMQNSMADLVNLHLLPALQRADLLAFGAYMADLQAYNGAYFAPVQGGQYASADVAQALQCLQQLGVACVGQSSWGPTGFAIVENQAQAEALKTQAEQAFAGQPNISFSICSGRNHGAVIKTQV